MSSFEKSRMKKRRTGRNHDGDEEGDDGDEGYPE
jgi:hypothetical protein